MFYQILRHGRRIIYFMFFCFSYSSFLLWILQVDMVHAQFVNALQELFEKYKDKVGYPGLELRVI